MDRHLIAIDLNLHELLNGGDFGRFPWSHFELPTLHVQLSNYRRNSSKKQGICSRPPQNLMTGGGFCWRSLFFSLKKQVTKREQKNNQPLGAPPLSVSPAICATWQYLSYEIMGSGSPVADGFVDHPKFASESNFLQFSWQKQFKGFKKKQTTWISRYYLIFISRLFEGCKQVQALNVICIYIYIYTCIFKIYIISKQ